VLVFSFGLRIDLTLRLAVNLLFIVQRESRKKRVGETLTILS
jgi:hypothetical protein